MESDTILEPSATDLSTLHDRLDTLWTQYLTLLDTYHSAQKQVQKDLASGFFSLAQANFKSSTNRRYGQDYYDSRATAITRVSVRSGADDGGVKVQIWKLKVPGTKSAEKERETAGREMGENGADESDETGPAKHDLPAQLPTPEPTPEPESKPLAEDEKVAPSPNGQTRSESTDRPLRDPMRQFGILVPPALRTAQKAFATAIQGPDGAISAVNALRGMREVEVEIRKLRKVIKKTERKGEA